MKFLIDECISARVVPLLTGVGHDVAHVEDRGLAGHVDQEVLELARSEGRVLVSADTDFGEILASSGALLPSFVLLRQGNRSPLHRAATLLANLDEVADDLVAGAVVVLTDCDESRHRSHMSRDIGHCWDPGHRPRFCRCCASRFCCALASGQRAVTLAEKYFPYVFTNKLWRKDECNLRPVTRSPQWPGRSSKSPRPVEARCGITSCAIVR
ncbi:MAG: DUF5615 family PIN-like protein [Nocardioidaceae bacterium]|nr:DUF5615 family PIN-like protein [Nocardioidaceae bacterium]